MIERAKSIVQETGVYSELEAYTGHPIDERNEKVVLEYYIHDDFNCLRGQVMVRGSKNRFIYYFDRKFSAEYDAFHRISKFDFV